MGWRRDDPNADAPQEAAEGLAASANIPVADASQVNAAYCLRFLRQIRDVSFATVDADGLPSVRIVDIMHAEDDRLYFLVPRGKALHAELTRMPTVAIVGQTTDFRSCRLRGCAVRPEGAEEQRRLVDWMFELNPAMNELYPGDSRYICDVFLIENGSGERECERGPKRRLPDNRRLRPLRIMRQGVSARLRDAHRGGPVPHRAEGVPTLRALLRDMPPRGYRTWHGQGKVRDLPWESSQPTRFWAAGTDGSNAAERSCAAEPPTSLRRRAPWPRSLTRATPCSSARARGFRPPPASPIRARASTSTSPTSATPTG